MIHDARVFDRIDQVTRQPRPTPSVGPRRTVIVPGESRYQRMSAGLPASSGSPRSGASHPASQPKFATVGARRREMTRPQSGRAATAVRRAFDAVVRRR